MRAQSSRAVRAMAYGALSLTLIASPLMLAGPSAAQNAPAAGQSAHDAALAAAAKRDYVAALELSKQAAAAGQPLEADQVDFIAGKAAQQQAAADEAARAKATQVAAQESATKIMDRQQKDYAEREKKLADRKSVTACGQQAMSVGAFSSSYSAAAGQMMGPGGAGGPAFSGAPQAPPPITNEKPGNC